MKDIISRDQAKTNGLKRYFTGEPCIHGHVSERLVSNQACMKCANERQNASRSENPDKRKHEAKKERERYREKIKKDIAIYRIENSEKIAKTQAVYRDRNRDKRREESLKWSKENPEKMREAGRNRRAAQKNAKGTHTMKDIQDLFYLQKERCATCEKKIFFDVGNRFHVDHIVALVNGGSNDKRNLQLLCRSCNCRKGKKDPIDWERQNGKML